VKVRSEREFIKMRFEIGERDLISKKGSEDERRKWFIDEKYCNGRQSQVQSRINAIHYVSLPILYFPSPIRKIYMLFH